jgi:hypothetical protein
MVSKLTIYIRSREWLHWPDTPHFPRREQSLSTRQYSKGGEDYGEYLFRLKQGAQTTAIHGRDFKRRRWQLEMCVRSYFVKSGGAIEIGKDEYIAFMTLQVVPC